jgi:tetratricopeptide (TPR) repeat protein
MGEVARRQYQQALEVREQALRSKEKPELAVDWSGLGRAQLALKKPAEAALAFERAVELREKGDEPADLALARFDLARALWEAGGDGRPKALALCQQAREAVTGEVQAMIDKWVASRQ